MPPPHFVRRVWIVWFDHEAFGVYRSRKAAQQVVKLLGQVALDGFKFWVVGPYKLTAVGLKKWEPK